MAADPLQNVGVDQPLEIYAASVNAWNAAARAHKNQVFDAGGRVRPSPVHPRLTVKVRNDSGSQLSAFSVVAITGKLLDPENTPFEFVLAPLLTADIPGDQTDPIVVLNEPLGVDTIGEATIAGVTKCNVLINSAAHKWAVPISGDATKLTSASSGSVRILWAAGTSGTQPCVVHLLDRSISSGGSGYSLWVTDDLPGSSFFTDVAEQIFNLATVAAVPGFPGRVSITPRDAGYLTAGIVSAFSQTFSGSKEFIGEVTVSASPGAPGSKLGNGFYQSNFFNGTTNSITTFGSGYIFGPISGWVFQPDDTSPNEWRAWIDTTRDAFVISPNPGISHHIVGPTKYAVGNLDGVSGTTSSGDTVTGGIITGIGAASPPYTPAVSGDWAGNPATLAAAIDRLAAAVAGLLGSPIP